MANELLQSTAFRCVFKAFLTGTNTPATGKTIAVTISKNGGSFGNPSGGATNATEVANGWYYVDGSTTDAGTLGDLVVRGTEGSIDPAERLFRVVKATNRGMTGIPDAAADAAGGLPISDAGGLDLDTRLGCLDAAVTTRQATFTSSTGVTLPSTVASSTEVTAIQNNTRVVRVVPDVIERPDSGTTTYRVELLLYDTTGNMEAPDSAPTIALVNQSGTDRSSRLDSTTMSPVSTGRYRAIYTADAADAIEQLVWTFSVVEGSATRLYGNTSLVVDTTAVDFTSADRAKLDTLHDTRLTSARAGYLDSLSSGVPTAGQVAVAVHQTDVTDYPGGTSTFGGMVDAIYDAVTALPTAGAVADAVFDEALSGHTTSGTAGERLSRIPNAAAGANGGLPTVDANNKIAGIQSVTFPSNFGSLAISAGGLVKIQSGVTKNAALANFAFVMVLSSDHVTGATGLTVTATRSIDGGSFASCANAVQEVASGVYKINLAAADLNGDVVVLKFAAATADTRLIELLPTP